MTKTTLPLNNDIVFQKELQGRNFTFHSTWGLFSPKNIDEGTELLINAIQPSPTDVSLDLGCGYGAIGLTLAASSPNGTVHMIDKDFVAVEYAKKNAKINNLHNVEAYLSNGFSHVPQTQFDIIASNVPAKVGKELYWIMIHDAKRYLKPGGRLYLVFLSGLHEFFKRNLKEVFGNYIRVTQSKIYTVAYAANTS